MSYQILDKIADSYIPLLALFGLVSVFIPSGLRIITDKFIRLLGLVLLAYSFMYLDNYFGVFPSVGLDYSTHTALSLGLTYFLSWLHKQYKIYFLSVLVAYLLLMLYQQYHTVADIIATGIVMTPFVWLMLRNLGKSKPTNSSVRRQTTPLPSNPITMGSRRDKP